MSFMFFEALAFDQSLGNWTLHNSVNLSFFLNSAGMSCSNYSETLIGWASNSSTPNSRNLGASGMQYGPGAVSARNTLIGKSWTIAGDVFNNICLPTTVCNGSAWSNGTPNNTMYAILNGIYNTFSNGNLTAKVLQVNSLLFVANSTSVTVLDSILNNSNIFSYDGIVSGTIIGNAVNSASVPTIVSQPASQTVDEASPALFSVQASGGSLSYEWREGSNIVGTNSPSYTIASASISDNGKRFVVIVSNFCGIAVSDSATLNVNPLITSLRQTLPTDSFISYAEGRTIYTEVSQPADVHVYNALGKLIGTGKNVVVPSAGVYLVKVLFADGIWTTKIRVTL